MSKRNIILLGLLLLVGLGYYIFTILWPSGPNLDEVPNPVRDRASQDWTILEAKAERNELKTAYFGDLHVHTQYSFDAFIGGNRVTPSGAYDFAKGKEIEVIGENVKIERPLDFAAITDHSEYFGELYSIHHSDAPGYNTIMARYLRGIGLDQEKQTALFQQGLENIGEKIPEHVQFFQGFETTKSTWGVQLDAAEKHYEPGKFTTFAAYEWTRNDGMAHIHRNVFFRDMKVPDYPVSAIEAQDENTFWESLEEYRRNGATTMAIPHNSNLSEGGAFPLEREGAEAMTLEYAQRRNLNEPLVEIHQAKGNSEVHAQFWGNDEYADFENYHQGPPIKADMVRHIVKKGLEYQEELGVNPYKYGFIGSTDTHNGVPGNVEETDNSLGNHCLVDLKPETRAERDWVLDPAVMTYEAVNPGGLAVVWSESNTRPDLYDNMINRETYATSGTRIQVRFFAGHGYKDSYDSYENMVADGYDKGVPMGGDINGGESPSFIIWASKDAIKANLDRVQVIKGWYQDGKLNEKIYDAVIASNAVEDELASVNLTTGEWDKTKGAAILNTVWTDPDFDSKYNAFYYLRVLEVPTPRWSLWDEIKHGVKHPDNIPKVIRERAWSSPIWYNPK